MNKEVIDLVQDHEKRITQLEKNEQELKNSMLRLENTVINSSNTTNNLLNKLVDHHFSDKTEQTKSKTEIIKAKIGLWSGILGAGGVVVLFLQWLSTKI